MVGPRSGPWHKPIAQPYVHWEKGTGETSSPKNGHRSLHSGVRPPASATLSRKPVAPSPSPRSPTHDNTRHHAPNPSMPGAAQKAPGQRCPVLDSALPAALGGDASRVPLRPLPARRERWGLAGSQRPFGAAAGHRLGPPNSLGFLAAAEGAMARARQEAGVNKVVLQSGVRPGQCRSQAPREASGRAGAARAGRRVPRHHPHSTVGSGDRRALSSHPRGASGSRGSHANKLPPAAAAGVPMHPKAPGKAVPQLTGFSCCPTREQGPPTHRSEEPPPHAPAIPAALLGHEWVPPPRCSVSPVPPAHPHSPPLLQPRPGSAAPAVPPRCRPRPVPPRRPGGGGTDRPAPAQPRSLSQVLSQQALFDYRRGSPGTLECALSLGQERTGLQKGGHLGSV